MGKNKRDGDVIYDNFDQYTGQPFNTKVLTHLPDGIEITDAIVDNAVIFKNKPELGGGYSVRSEWLESGVLKSSWFGTKGDGITDDTEAIQKLFDSKFLSGKVIFNKGVYIFSQKLTVTSKNNFEIDFQESTLYDLCKESKSTTDVDILIPVGIEFVDCLNFRINNLIHNSNVPLGGYQIATDRKSERVPQISFESCINYTVHNVKMKGLVGARIDINDAVSPEEFFSASYMRHFLANKVVVDSCEIGQGAGGGEFFTFVDSSNINWRNCLHLQNDAPITFWSFGKVINCTNTKISDHIIESNSPGSLIDWSGDGLEVRGLHINYPNGKFLDFAGEFGEFFTTAKNVKIRDCSTNGTGLLLSTPIGTNPIIENIDISGLVLSRENSTDFDNRIYGVKDILISNVKYVNKLDLLTYISPSQGFDYKRNAVLDNIRIECNEDFTYNSTNLQNAGLLNIVNSNVNMKGKSVTFTDIYSSSFNVPLTDSDYLCKVSNTSFNNTILNIHSNIEFYNCSFYNCKIVTRGGAVTNRNYPSMVFNKCSFECIATSDSITASGVVFDIPTLGYLEIRDTELYGEVLGDGASPIVQLERTTPGDLNIVNTNILIKRNNVGVIGSLPYFLLLRNDDDAAQRTISFKNVNTDSLTNLFRISGGVSASPTNFITVNIDNVTHLMPSTMVRLDATHSANRYNITGKGNIVFFAMTARDSFNTFNVKYRCVTDSIGTPEDLSIASVGTVYIDGSSSIYIKKTGNGKTGWSKVLDNVSASVSNVSVSTITTIEEANTAIQALVTAFNAKLQADRNSGQQAT